MASEQFLEAIKQAEAEAETIIADAEHKASEINSEALRRADEIIAAAGAKAGSERQEELSQAEAAYRSMMEQLERDRQSVRADLPAGLKAEAVAELSERIVNLIGNR